MSTAIIDPVLRIAPSLLQAGVAESGLEVPWSVALLVASVVGYALVNTIEIAIIGSNRIRIRHLAEEGSRSAQAVERLRSREDRFFAGIVLLQNLFVFLASSMTGLLAVELAGGWGLVFATIIATSAIALLGEVTPKVVGAKASDRLALLFARPTELLITLLHPVVSFFAAAPNVLLRVFFGQGAEVTPTVTEAELRMLIDISAEEGAVGQEEAELMDRVFRFYDRQVSEVMVPRTEVVWLEQGSTIAEFLQVFSEHPHSRFPVYAETLDNVVGVINIKDVLRGSAQGRVQPETRIDAFLRPAYFVPETKLVGQLFVEMQERRQQMAIVVDEYGGTAGIVTLELLLEEMVGPVTDELGRPEQEFRAIDERTVQVDGGMHVDEVREQLQIPIPEGDYDTVAGYVLNALGHIPQEGETVAGEGFHVTVTKMDGRKIEQVVIRRTEDTSAPASEDAEEAGTGR